ncbi:MAG: enoyl-CoA hydratase/isomerase family protein [Chloroflexi bacterium]|nr:enoyl-CoA hydratase/isomerase family protein [Chloroflexota bacterium]
MALEVVNELLYEVEDSGILWIKFNRPERQNALFVPDTITKLGEYLRAGDADPRVRVIVITGVGKAFCAGLDLKTGYKVVLNRSEKPDASRQKFLKHFHIHIDAISETRKPTIAMINGAAVGIGMDIALRCDIRMGCEWTRFFTYQNVGQIIENGGSYFLPKLAGLGRALELAFTGGFLKAEEAYRWGILNHLVPADQLKAETRSLCQKIVASPPLVQWINKRIMRRALDVDLKTVQDLCANASGILFASEDSKEARKAWSEKRTPVFNGR